MQFQQREFPFLRFFSPREFKHIPLALIAIVCKCFSKKPTTVLEKPFSSIRLDYKFHYYRCNSPKGWEKPTIYVVRALQTWSSRWSSIEFARSGSREYRYVLTPQLLSFPRSFFALHDRWETEKMRSTRQEGRKSLGHGRERVQRRLRRRRRGRCFPWMPAASFDAFYPESWIPRVPTARLAPSTGTRTVIGPFQRDRRCTVFSAATIPL